eukprot:NODE_3438_length_786_cov_206.818057.p1 GENE.NODE_3438_length_786_cov_206.818057~~NODE_3438_length_786_cov_206.818057.p1  ORF type:complete len:174 (-),score=21.97 NODE_3438_length_786_cov_206.818057:196-717(-)
MGADGDDGGGGAGMPGGDTPAGVICGLVACAGRAELVVDPWPTPGADGTAALTRCRMHCRGASLFRTEAAVLHSAGQSSQDAAVGSGAADARAGSRISPPLSSDGAMLAVVGRAGGIASTATDCVRNYNWAGFPAALGDAAQRLVLQAGRITWRLSTMGVMPPGAGSHPPAEQ